MNAFRNDPAVKAELIDHVRPRWEARKLLPLPSLKADAERGLYSIAGLLADGEDAEVFETRTGVPVELALTCECLIMAGANVAADEKGVEVEGSDSIMSFGIEWLEAIRPGADLSSVLPRFMVMLLETLLRADFELAEHISAGTRTATANILSFWKRELAGEKITAAEWRPVRTDAVRNSEVVNDPWEYMIARSIDSFAWPLSGLPKEFVSIFQPLTWHLLAYIRQPYREGHDRADQVHKLVGMRRLAEPGTAEDMPAEEMLADLPESLRALMAITDPETKARARFAERRARAATDPFLRRQMDLMLTLIDEAR